MLRVHVFRFAQQLQDLARAGSQPAMLRQPLALDSELLDLGGLQVQRFQLAEVIAQQLEPRFAVLRRRGCAIALLAQLGPCAVLLGYGIEQLAIVATLIEQLALRGALHQRLVFHLAVNVDERLAELPQCLDRHRLAVHIRARAAVSADYSPQHAFALVLDRLIGEPRARRSVIRDRESCGDLGALGAVPYDFGTGAPAGREQQRVYEDRLAGTCFACEHREAGGELQLGGVDDCEIADLNMKEHGARQSCDCAGGTRSPRPQRSFERRMRK